ncbi:unnamed protein product [Anisakis simplex]|uniref:Uncharacterized protein n=1 Tax=Anisakis simplex TaxID=6269 RepID=A0A0M3J2C7_ANISI|nr:unnamed protein product [Anisakis simplex]
MVGSTVKLPEEENTPEKRVDRIFKMMDKVQFQKKILQQFHYFKTLSGIPLNFWYVT